ncbi:unnamed protein product [Caenorhabditis sp. 36 PRJEB53466]|nr:unnamed protein product [Caenorhabditis sp. 36 PRJEB53466]
MMMRKNIELQLQALQMIEFMCGLIPSVLQLEEGETLRHMKKLTPEETERYVLISVLRHSKDEYDAMQKGSDELEQVARDSRAQREQLEQDIRREEFLLQKALNEGAKKRQGASTQTNAPLSVAAMMASHFTIDNGTSTDDISFDLVEKPKQATSSTSGTMTSPEARLKSAKRTGCLEMSDVAVGGSQQKEKRPGTAKGPNQRKFSKAGLEDLVGVQNVEQQKNEPLKDVENVDKADALAAANATIGKEPKEGPSTRKNNRNELSGATDGVAQTSSDAGVQKEKEKKEASRPSTRKSIRNAASGTVDGSSGSRPVSRKDTTSHEPRAKTPASKSSDDRPTTRRSSVDKLAPKRNDSVPRERSFSVSKKDKDDSNKKPPKSIGPLRSNNYDGEVPMGRPGSPGMDHGPRRKNLNDVNSHLVDPSRLNSSDVRSRAQYLREQRDKLLQLKNEERIKQMNDIQRTTVERPRTSRAARGFLDKKEAEEIRKEINDKLKTEILTLN